MAKIDLDKYYTPVDLAKHCICVVKSLNLDITEFLEPSAGNGSFSLQIPNCLAYDIEPEHDSIVKQDFLTLDLPYKEGRMVIGNPPFGVGNILSVQFFKKACKIGDYIAFVLPISQYKNNIQMYDFDLIHSEALPMMEFSGKSLLCCFNVFKKPCGGANKKPPKSKMDDVSIIENRRGGAAKNILSYDFGLCMWGASIGKEPKYIGQFALEGYVTIHKPEYKTKVIEVLKNAKWTELYPNIATPKLNQWQIFKYIRDCFPELS